MMIAAAVDHAFEAVAEALAATPIPGAVLGAVDRAGAMAVRVAGDAQRVPERIEATRADHHRVPAGREELGRGLADAARRAGDHGGPTFGVLGEPCAHRATTVVGRVANPRTFAECTRAARATSMS